MSKKISLIEDGRYIIFETSNQGTDFELIEKTTEGNVIFTTVLLTVNVWSGGEPYCEVTIRQPNIKRDSTNDYIYGKWIPFNTLSKKDKKKMIGILFGKKYLDKKFIN